MSVNDTPEDVRTVVLNERQKSILQSVGLSEEYEELSYFQQKGIVEIEHMLSYLETKYDKEFQYRGYSNGVYERKWLEACAVGEIPETDSFRVSVAEDGSYSDDYPWITYRRIYDAYLKEMIGEICGQKNVKVFTINGKTDLDDVRDLSVERIKGHLWACTTIFLFDCDTEMVRTIFEKYIEWNKQNAIRGQGLIGLIEDKNDWDGLSRVNCSKYNCRLKEKLRSTFGDM